MRIFAKVFLIATLLAVFAAGAPLAADHLIVMNGDYGGAMFFDPPAITINVGDRIQWHNAMIEFHTATSGTDCIPNGAWTTGTVNPGATSGFVAFPTVGSIDYYCRFHCEMGMVGLITVQQAPVKTEAKTWGAIKALYATARK